LIIAEILVRILESVYQKAAYVILVLANFTNFSSPWNKNYLLLRVAFCWFRTRTRNSEILL